MKKNFLKILMLFLVVVTIASFSKVEEVKAATSYKDPETEFRGVWLSNYIGSVGSYQSEESFKAELTKTLDILEYYHINAMLFHVRTHNNALYNSTLNPIATWWRNVNFDEFDPLAWLIEECHKRGIEFHAWLNPYRVNDSYCATDYPEGNPARDKNNLLNGDVTILDPGIPANREFIVKTCMEVVENYDIDAIHFDDYFYVDNINDDATYNKYKQNSTTTTKADWRREQVDIFIERLHNELTKYNEKTGKYVQLGISPTGIYKNGNGIVTYDENGLPITNGSDTNGFSHYDRYLYCDTLKWAIEEWIDYLLPQTYWAQNHPSASYTKLLSWWDRTMKNLKTNLYSGIGIYMPDQSGNTYGWKTNPDELLEQLTYVSTLENVKGACLYSYNYLRSAYNGDTSTLSSKTIADLRTSCWTRDVLLPEIRTAKTTTLETVKNFKVDGNTLSWDPLPNAKFYAIYRAPVNLSFAPTELINVVGGTALDGTFTYEDDAKGYYEYGIRAISYTGNLGEKTKLSLASKGSFDILTDVSGDEGLNGTEVTANAGSKNGKTIGVTYTRSVFLDSNAPSSSRLDYNWTSSNEEVATISQYGTITALKKGETIITGVLKTDSTVWGQIKIIVYENKEEISKTFKVTFKDHDGTILKEETVDYASFATAPEYPANPGVTFIGWSDDFSCVLEDLEITAYVSFNQYKVIFQNFYGANISVQYVYYGEDAIVPSLDEIPGKTFISWDHEYENITGDVTIKPLYEEAKYKVSFVDYDGTVLKEVEVSYLEDATPPSDPVREGYNFRYWSGSYNKVTKDSVVTATYMKKQYTVTFVDENNEIISEVKVKYGEAAEAPETDSILNFSHWDLDFSCVKENIVVTAITADYLIKFIDKDDQLISEYYACENEEISFPNAPSYTGYNFVGWDNDETSATSDMTFKAVYEKISFTVTFVDYDGKIIASVKTEYGSQAVAPEISERKGYKFVGWDNDITNITSDLTVNAVYTKDTDKGGCASSLTIVNLLMSLSILSFVFIRRKR